MDSKKWYESKVVWFNIIGAIVTIMAFPEFINVIPETWLPFTALVMVVGNWILRVYSTRTSIR